MPETRPGVGAWLDRFFDSLHRHRPVDATFIGVHEHDHRLPDVSEPGVGEALSDVDDLLAEAETLGADDPRAAGPGEDLPDDGPREHDGTGGLPPLPAGDAEALDLRLARGFLRIWRWELVGGHFHSGNPSLYTAEAAFGFLSLFLGHGGSVARRVEAAGRRMKGVAFLLAQARENVRRAPPWWTERAIRECRGLLELFGDGVDALAADLDVDPAALRGPADDARRAAAEHLTWLESELLARPTETVAAGEEALDLCLRQGHFVAEPVDELVAYAEDRMAEADGWLRAHARDFGADTVEDVLAGLEEIHPTVDGYLSRYRELWDEVRALCEREGLITWREFPIRYVPRPDWVRKAAPYLYFLHYRSPAAHRRPPVHDYLVTPIDGSVPPDRRRALLRAHNDGVIKLNHVVHHGGIGHHQQNWNAFHAESRVGRVAAVDCASRIAMACGGTMAEGWACYATDLVGEFGGLTPLEAYAERRSRVRMCARAVVDLRLHRGRMGLEEAAAFYVDRAGMSEAAARAEAVKNSMFPGGAVMYLAGTDAIHRLRREMEALRGSDFDLRDFHDTFLSYGSVPVTLVAEDMKRRGAAGPERRAAGPEVHAR